MGITVLHSLDNIMTCQERNDDLVISFVLTKMMVLEIAVDIKVCLRSRSNRTAHSTAQLSLVKGRVNRVMSRGWSELKNTEKGRLAKLENEREVFRLLYREGERKNLGKIVNFFLLIATYHSM